MKGFGFPKCFLYRGLVGGALPDTHAGSPKACTEGIVTGESSTSVEIELDNCNLNFYHSKAERLKIEKLN